MKLDYKTNSQSLTWPSFSFKHVRHLGLGALGVLCLILAFSNTFKKTSELLQQPLNAPIALPLASIPKPELGLTPSTIPTPMPPAENPQTNNISLAKNTPEKSKPEIAKSTATPESTESIKGKKIIEKQLAFRTGAIHRSLVSSGKKAGLDYKVIHQMVEILGGKIDFATDLRPNDSFRVLYEQKINPNQKVEAGNILAVEFINQGEKYQAIRYTDKTGHSAYFSPEGQGFNDAFLRSPVQFVDISSSFGIRRHPIYHKMRQHKGIDYRAPHGTPVLATANAKVIFVGNRGGYGNVIELQHGARYSTLYAHLSRFAKNIRPGTEIKQGQVIGYVGRTGAATGDHLHYEFRIDGIHRNPLTAVMPKQNSIPPAQRSQFIAHAKEMIRLMDEQQDMQSGKSRLAGDLYPSFIIAAR